MISMVAGDEDELRKKPASLHDKPTSPLQWDSVMIEGMMEYVKLGQIVVLAGNNVWCNRSVTLAGTVVQHNAEVLSMITFSQLINPGAPVLYGAVSTVMVMKTTAPRLGGPELGIMHVCFAQLAKRIIFHAGELRATLNSKTLDIQAGYETAFNLTLAS